MPISSQLTETVVRIREMILRGALARGQRVAEAPLAEMLGMSRTPVRQALPLLAQEGLLMEHETRGYVVRAFTAADIVDAIEVRASLEGMMARRVAEKGASKAFIRELRACLEDGDAILEKRHVVEADEALYADMNKRFHDLIMNEAGSAIFSDALDRNNRVPFAGAQALAFDRDNLDAMYDMLQYGHRQHHHIVNAIEQGEGARTEALMREHAIAVKSSINIAELQMAGPASRLAAVR